MTAPVDVLAVLRANMGPHSEVVAAVAELIEAAKEMLQQDAVQRATHNTNPFMADAADRLSDALGKAGAK